MAYSSTNNGNISFQVNPPEQFTFKPENGKNGVADLRGSGLPQVQVKKVKTARSVL